MTDRLIQIVALAVLVAGLVATLLLTPNINRQRIDRQLTYDMAAGDASNPQYTLLASTGAFRGIAVNVMWYRIEELKQQGKFAEANTLARTIVSLQPRFPGAWEFMSWNMAYNISIQCKTQEERWYWVNNGLELLRSEGIPNNPRSIQLYRQLSWTLSHKMGGRTDDMHWYYKRQFAEEWETVLFAPVRGKFPRLEPGETPIPQNEWHELTPERFDWATIHRFRDVDHMAQTYLRSDAAGDAPWSPEHYHNVLTPDIRQRFFDDYPRYERVVEQLEALRGPAGEPLGLGMNTETLKAFGYILMLARSGYNIDDPAIREGDGASVEVQALLNFLQETNSREPTPENPRLGMNQEPRDGREAWLRNSVLYRMIPPEAVPQILAADNDPNRLDLSPLLDLLRAHALVDSYHMDPGYMMWLMEEYGPLDWRHVNTHALYWSSLGTIMARELIDRSRIDFINNDRQTLHAIQGLAYQGTLVFRPRVEAFGDQGEGVIQSMVDTRFFEAYDMALTRTREMIASEEAISDVKADTYDTGYENFLHTAVMYSYYGGQTGLADRYFQKLKDVYGGPGSRSPYVSEYELLDLPTFAYERLISDDLYDSKVGYLSQLIARAWREGMIQRDPQITVRYLTAARQFYDQILEDYNSSPAGQGLDTQERMDLIPFEEQIAQQFLFVITDPSYGLFERASMWQIALQLIPDAQLKFEIYYQMAGPLSEQMQRQGLGESIGDLFPMPQGFMEWYEQLRQRQEQERRNNAGPGLRNN